MVRRDAEFWRQDDCARMQTPRWLLPLADPLHPHSVAASPWRDGKATKCGKWPSRPRPRPEAGGLSLAGGSLPLRTNPKNPAGYYGNGSSNLLSVIPTDPASFKSDPSRGAAAAGFTNYSYEVDDYNRYFLNELYELLTEYGPIQEVWFDGANPIRGSRRLTITRPGSI